ncbi:unnamed protein product [Acanthoscelides obtectus]|uniref:RING-type E3 ubiquitin transferase n=1 Tax=Acanthoscelides obtectus TaxID=200917 RepID=A0A9P0L2H9_ACAOB|nr:unnamed protein product [Acanthoscelides obtectus]CAK1626482.1 E3 ubiquitin-protein ligase DZIP3 [Acanthoscelides obtectus]
MGFQFHPLAFGVMLLVAAGTIAYTFWNSNREQNNRGRHNGYSYDDYNTRYCGSSISSVRSLEDSEDDDDLRRRPGKCTICLTNLKGRSIKQLKCRHQFHERCINGWLTSNNTCPNCRMHI